MNKIHHILLAIVLVLLLPVSAQALDRGDRLHPFTAKDMDGKTIDLATVIGTKPVMLIFWASWCPNCSTEVPKVTELVEKYRGQGMEFIGINVGHNDSKERARRFMEETGMNYPVIFDKQSKITRQYSVFGVPTILVADKKGLIVLKYYGVPEITDEIFKKLNRN